MPSRSRFKMMIFYKVSSLLIKMVLQMVSRHMCALTVFAIFHIHDKHLKWNEIRVVEG